MENKEQEEAPSDIVKILTSILKTESLEEILLRSEELQNFIKANRPSLLFLMAEFEKIFANLTDLEKFLDTLALVLQAWEKKGLTALPYKSLFRAFFKVKNIKELTEKDETLKKKVEFFVKSSWEYLNVDAFKDFFSGFDLLLVDKLDQINFIKKKETELNWQAVAKSISFFGLFDDFDREKITLEIFKTAQIKKDKGSLELLSRLIKPHPTSQDSSLQDTHFIDYLIMTLCTNDTVTYSARIIKKYHLDPHQYPGVLERIKKKALRYNLWKNGWEVSEERFYNHPEILAFLAEDLCQPRLKMFQEAWSIVQRHDLLKKGLVKKKEPLEYFETHPNMVVLGNKIYQNDSFNPIEENVGSAKNGHFINLRDFGVNEENVLYVDSLEGKEFERAKSELGGSKMIGLDSEFIMTSTSFENGGISIFQISNDKNAFIFDMEKVSSYPEFIEFFFDLLADKNITKIGHTITSDIKMMKKNPNLSVAKKGFLNNYVEIPHIFKALNPGDKFSSLAHIAEFVLKKPMSKGDQCSNWSKKPLRKSQLHYAALDAVICVMIYKEMEKLCEKVKLNIEEFHNDILLGNANSELKENSSGEEDEELKELEGVELEEETQNEEKKENKNGKNNQKKNGGKKQKKEQKKQEHQKEEVKKEDDTLFGD